MDASTAHTGDRVVVVTGGASGIGAATVQRFHAGGALVILVDVDPAAVGTSSSLPSTTAIVGDVAEVDTWREVRRVCDELGRVDVLVSNAVRQLPAAIVDLAPDDWDAQLEVNVRGAYLGLRALLPALQQSSGCAVLVSSVHARVGIAGHPAYAASKGALCALARQVAVDYAPVRVNCVLPGPILTRAWDGIDEPDRARTAALTALKRFGNPDEVAAVIEFLASDAASYVTGTELVVDGGFTTTKDSS